MDSELPEVAVVCDYDAPILAGMRQDVGICLAAEARLYHGEYVLTSLTQNGNHVRMNILVGQQRVRERLHAGIFTSHTTSFFNARAA